MQNNMKPADASNSMSAGKNQGGGNATMPATVAIDGMSGDACVQKVKSALSGIEGVTTNSVRVGEAKITATEAGCDAACDAIAGAGYKPDRTMAKQSEKHNGTGATKPMADMPGKPGTPGSDAQRSQNGGQNSSQNMGQNTGQNTGHAGSGQQRTGSSNATPDVDVKPTPAVAGTKR